MARAESGRAIPAPALDETNASPTETIVLAGGCFWGVQGVFQHVKGVISATSGYSGGPADKADYETVSTGTTGHAESVKVTFDPRIVSLGRILQVYFSVAQDPTELNYQGPDEGTQYRSDVFAATPEQAKVARAYVAQLDAAHAFGKLIVTRVDMLAGFYPAEGYHQNFLVRHPSYPYIVYNDLPKIADLKRLLPALWRQDPVLALSTTGS
ncbi:MAG: peptide-methionine (S)-S-oxide reductase MsrA [Hyphomicrobiales bacterium]|nr:peptide-methionine (S)-S-oxide reductase MsrA [Hyphomicrobiales bacterium]